MSRLVYDISMSIDGYIAASGMTADEGLGIGGEVLHDWYMAGEEHRRRPIAEYYDLGAFISGRRTYDNSIKWWGAEGHAAGPTIVVSHSVPEKIPGKKAYRFVKTIEEGLMAANGAARGKDIRVMGGSVAGQLLRAGLLDEIAVHIAPVLFGSGLPLFGERPQQLDPHVNLERIEVVSTDAATHIFYRVIKA